MYLSINEFKARDFYGSNALWNYVVVNAPMEVSHNPPRPIGIFTPKLHGIIAINNIHDIVNIDESDKCI
jgi:hypothetical protein